ncbi:Cell morphogenesis protein PAG1, partial [Dipsacomyces acuminosporus]
RADKHQQQSLRRASKKFTYETRNGLYQLFERWCCVGRYADTTKETELRMMGAALEHVKDMNEREYLANIMDEERELLEHASLRAMAVLCRSASTLTSENPSSTADKKMVESGGPRDKLALFAWISDALSRPDVRIQRIGQRAVEWTIHSDLTDASMFRTLIQLSYGMSVTSSINSDLSACPLPSSEANMSNASVASGLGLMFGVSDGYASGAKGNAAAAAAAAPSAMPTLSTDQ